MPILADLLGTSAQPRVSGLPRQRGSWGLVKPVQGSSIDWGHPLAKGLIFATILDGSGAVVDLTTGVRTIKPQTYRLGAGGTGTNSTAANATKIAAPRLIRSANAPVSAFTMTTQFRAVTASDFESGINASAYTSESINQGWGLSTRGGPGTPGFAFVLLNNNGEGVYALLHSTAAPWGTLNVPVTWGGTYDGTTGILYVNGLSRTSSALSYAAAPAGTTTTIASTDGGSPNFAFHLGYAWDRELQPSEMAWLNAEPYAMFAPPGPKRSYTFFSAPATQPVRRRVGSWGTTKPPVGTPINRGHPLARDLVASFALNEGGGKQLNNLGQYAGVAYGGSTLGWSRGGAQGATTNTDKTTTAYATQTGFPYWNGDITLSFGFSQLPNTLNVGEYNTIIARGGVFEGTNTMFAVGYVDRSGPDASIFFVGYNAGTLIDREWRITNTGSAASWTSFNNRSHIATITFNAGRGFRGWVDGHELFTLLATAGTNTLGTDGSHPLTVLGQTTHTSFGSNFGGVAQFAHIHRRVLADSEILQLHAEPYAMYAPPPTLSRSFSLESPPPVIPPFVGNLVTGGNLKLHAS